MEILPMRDCEAGYGPVLQDELLHEHLLQDELLYEHVQSGVIFVKYAPELTRS